MCAADRTVGEGDQAAKIPRFESVREMREAKKNTGYR